MIHHDAIPQSGSSRSSAGPAVRLGFVPLTDCAPLIVAREFGLFARHDVRVALSRELGWATVRDKLVHGELDAAHAPCGLPFALRLGLGSPVTDCVASLVLNLNGNGITLSHALARSGVSNLTALADYVRLNRRSRRLVFGVVSLHSTHAWLLRTWLSSAGIKPDEDVPVGVGPPPQLAGLSGAAPPRAGGYAPIRSWRCRRAVSFRPPS